MFSCEFCEISKNTFLNRTPLVAASGKSCNQKLFKILSSEKGSPIRNHLFEEGQNKSRIYATAFSYFASVFNVTAKRHPNACWKKITSFK